ncbi:MAG: hypothetical protein J7M26_01120 [Armatimonadetes bacterium]|nr:hypothetical protein [Armatimonadota bacterium]
MGKSVPRDILERARRLASVGGDPDLMVWWEHGWRAGYRSIEDYGHKSFTEVDPEIAEIMERRKREKRE